MPAQPTEAAVVHEPRWPAAVTIIAAVSLHFALPPSLRVGPPWVGATVVLAVMFAGWWAGHAGHTQLNELLGYVLAGALTVALTVGVGRLVFGVVGKMEAPTVILRSAAILWATNVITFALWYWRLDAGGPIERARERGARSRAFLFPQMTAIPEPLPEALSDAWRPHFVDYLFLSFNTSTAFSPTDVPVLSRWAKVLTMIESMISFTTIIVLVARAINTL